jgi:hypothetical protein
MLGSLGCNATKCHGAPTGKGGLRLSMFGADRERDYVALTRTDEGRRINWVEPLKSLLLLKVTGAIDHGGKQRVKPDTAEYKTLAAWLLCGAPRSAANERTIVAVEVSPGSLTLAPGATGNLSAMAVFSDGTRGPVTRGALYKSSDETIAVASPGGAI